MELETVDYLEHHATLLRTRQKWTARSAVIAGASIALAIVVQWLNVTNNTYDPHNLTYDLYNLMGLGLMIVGLILFVATVGIIYIVRKETLELLDVIRRATRDKH